MKTNRLFLTAAIMFIAVSLLSTRIATRAVFAANATAVHAITTPPDWWNGDCDSGNITGAHAVTSWQGVEACTPNPDIYAWFPLNNKTHQLEFECTELVMRFLNLEWSIQPWYGNAQDIFGNAPTNSMIRYNNGDSSHPPVAGDILTENYKASAPKLNGHVAVITDVSIDQSGSGTIGLLEQNVTEANGQKAGTRTVSIRNWTISDSWTGKPVQGWLHALANSSSSSGGVPTLNFSWGSSAWNFNLARQVRVEVRSPGSNSDIFNQSVLTNSSGGGSVTLTGVNPGSYDVYVKPTGFLRQGEFTERLVSGQNTLPTFNMNKSGGSFCTNGQSDTILTAGDINGDNVIDASDYALILTTIYGNPLPSYLATVTGHATMDAIDLNSYMRAICEAGGGTSAIIGDGGRSSTVDLNDGSTSAGHSSAVSKNATPPQSLQDSVDVGGGSSAAGLAQTAPVTLSLSPASGTYNLNQVFSVTVHVDSGGQVVDGVDAILRYDPTQLEVAALPAQTLFGTGQSSPVISNDPATGEIDLVGLATSGQGQSVSGVLASVQFQVIGTGNAPVVLYYGSGESGLSGVLQHGTGSNILTVVNSSSFTVPTPDTPAFMQTPGNGATLTGSSATFYWTPGFNAENYWLRVGTSVDGEDIYSSGVTTNLSAAVTSIPTDGRTIYVELQSFFPDTASWQTEEYTYTGAQIAQSYGLTVNANGCGTTNPSGSLTHNAGDGISITATPCDGSHSFSGWTITGASCSGGTSSSPCAFTMPSASVTVTASFVVTGGGNTCGSSSSTAAIVQPAPGSTLSGSTATFCWTAGSGVTGYWLYVGTSGAGAYNLYSSGQLSSSTFSAAVSNLPTSGTINVRLWVLANGVWQYSDYTFAA